MACGWIAVQVDGSGVCENLAEQSQSFGHVRQVRQHPAFAEQGFERKNGFEGGMIGVVVVIDFAGDELHSAFGFVVPLPHIGEGGFLGGLGFVFGGLVGAEEDVVVGFGVPRRVEINQIG